MSRWVLLCEGRGGEGRGAGAGNVGRQMSSEKGLGLQAQPPSTHRPPPPCWHRYLGQLGLLRLVAAGRCSPSVCRLPPHPHSAGPSA